MLHAGQSPPRSVNCSSWMTSNSDVTRLVRVADYYRNLCCLPKCRFLRVHLLGRIWPPQAPAPIEASLSPVRPADIESRHALPPQNEALSSHINFRDRSNIIGTISPRTSRFSNSSGIRPEALRADLEFLADDALKDGARLARL